jgi:hypothetical protein
MGQFFPFLPVTSAAVMSFMPGAMGMTDPMLLSLSRQVIYN